ncbi:MAG: hypothetical protein JNM90_21020 [Burkholderiales bacterium]|nr:hypothetical protein [Burkholderiales bacterium]
MPGVALALEGWATVGAAVLLAAILGLAGLAAHWRRACAGAGVHAFLGGALAVGLLWAARADLGHGIALQLLGVPLLALALGPALAMWAASLAAAVAAVLLEQPPATAIWSALVLGITPAALADLARRAVAQWLPAHLFIYILGAGFFGAGAAAILANLLAAALAVWAGVPGAAGAFDQALPFVLLIGFGEATLTGMLLTLLVVYLPERVATFEDTHYFRRR